jgi:hypothetical protein
MDFADRDAGNQGDGFAVDDYSGMVVLADHGGGLACVDHLAVDLLAATMSPPREETCRWSRTRPHGVSAAMTTPGAAGRFACGRWSRVALERR